MAITTHFLQKIYSSCAGGGFSLLKVNKEVGLGRGGGLGLFTPEILVNKQKGG